ncbi:MAG: lipid II:glycine glycyltransferase FemX [Ktedonobacterales bacterium]
MIVTRSGDWKTYVERLPASSLASSPAWLDLLQRVYGYTVTPLTATNAAGEITGVLPLCRLQSPLIGKRLVAVPFVDHAPLLADDDASADALVTQALELARAERAKYLELRTGQSAALAARPELRASDLYVRWLVALDGGAPAAWKALHKPVQRQVKKAQKSTVSVRLADRREDMLTYHQLHVLTRCRKHGMPAQPRRYFLDLWDTFAANGTLQLLLAEHEGQVIAGIVLLASGDTLRYAYGGSDPRFLGLAPNNLLMWEAIERAAARGFRTLDLGRTARDNEGLMQFKRGWGAQPDPLTYYYSPQLQGLATTSEHSWKYRLATGGWKHLPLPVAEAVGGRLYKHLG